MLQVERLSATGEEALVLTASCQDGTCMQFGSQKAEGFLRKQLNLGDAFLTFCNGILHHTEHFIYH